MRRSPRGRLATWVSWPVKLLIALALRLPRHGVQGLGALLGTLWFWLIPLRRAVVLDNLSQALPELSRRRRWQVAAGAFRHLATTVLEIFWFSKLDRVKSERHVTVEGLERYQAIRSTGRGVVAVTGHLGNWDLLACSQALAGVPLSVVTKSLSARGLSRLWMEARTATGLNLLAARGSALAIVRALRRGEVVGLVVDQRTSAQEGGLPLNFFGRPALTTPAPHLLAAKTGAAILPVWSYRTPAGDHHVIVCEEVALGGTSEETMSTINRLLEGWIRQHPEQYLWHHRRWRP